MAPPATQWDDALEKRFLLEVAIRGGASAANMLAIAEKWGTPHTKGSLSMKFSRMQKKYAEENGLDIGPSKETSKMDGGKRKAADGLVDGSENVQAGKPKKPRSMKAKKAVEVKAEPDNDEDTKVDA